MLRLAVSRFVVRWGGGGRCLLSSPSFASESFAMPFGGGVGGIGGEGNQESVESDVLPFQFTTSFLAKCDSLYAVQEGGYVDLDKKELSQYLPEGLAGEMEVEFDFADRQAWMVRSSTKLLCRVLDLYVQGRKEKLGMGAAVAKVAASSSSKSQRQQQQQQQQQHQKVFLPTLSDRPEWKEARLRVHFYGAEILKDDKQGLDNNYEDTVHRYLQKLAAYEAAGNSASSPKVLVTGARGVGKSATINQVVLHARKNGWMCLFVPRGWDQVQSGWYIEPLTNRTVSGEAACFDNPFMSAEILRGFWRAHHDQLKLLPITRPQELEKYDDYLTKFKEAWNRALSVSGREKLSFREMREIIEAEEFFQEQDVLDAGVLDKFDFLAFKPKNLEDLVQLGVAFRELAGSVFLDLVEELKLIDGKNGQPPILIAVDQYNTWEVPSAYQYKNEVVRGWQLVVPKALKFISKTKSETQSWQLKHGVCICATSHAHPQGRENYEQAKSSVPLVVQIPAYSQVEFLSSLSYYQNQKRIVEGVETQELLSYRMHTGSNPRNARIEAVPYFFPIAIDKNTDGEDYMSPFLTQKMDAFDGANYQTTDNDEDTEDTAASLVDSVISKKR